MRDGMLSQNLNFPANHEMSRPFTKRRGRLSALDSLREEHLYPDQRLQPADASKKTKDADNQRKDTQESLFSISILATGTRVHNAVNVPSLTQKDEG